MAFTPWSEKGFQTGLFLCFFLDDEQIINNTHKEQENSAGDGRLTATQADHQGWQTFLSFYDNGLMFMSLYGTPEELFGCGTNDDYMCIKEIHFHYVYLCITFICRQIFY